MMGTHLTFGQLLARCSGCIFFDIRVNDATESPSMGDPMLGVGGWRNHWQFPCDCKFIIRRTAAKFIHLFLNSNFTDTAGLHTPIPTAVVLYSTVSDLSDVLHYTATGPRLYVAECHWQRRALCSFLPRIQGHLATNWSLQRAPISKMLNSMFAIVL